MFQMPVFVTVLPKVLVPAAVLIIKELPLAIDVVPVTVKLYPATVNAAVVPDIARLPPIDKAPTVVAVAVPDKVRLPLIVIVPACNVLALVFASVKL